MVSILNLIRLILLFLLCLPAFPFFRHRAVFFFLRFSGPSFIKLGQVLSVRPDLVGEELAEILAVFQDKLAAFPAKKVQEILQKEFKKGHELFFAEFDYTPVASASIAQVHKARLHNGRQVAVKILRPNIEKIMARDIKTLKLMKCLFKPFSSFLAQVFSDIFDLLTQVAKNELDLLHEAANASKLKEDSKEANGFHVPEIFWQFSTKRVLVLEWIDGIAFSNRQKIVEVVSDGSLHLTRKEIARNLVVSYFNQVYVHGFFHADMHPGNLFLMKNGDIGVVDFGIMGRIDKKTRIAVAEILIGFLHKEYKRVAQVHIDAGLVPVDTNVDDLAISCRKIGEIIVGSSVRDISLAILLQNLIKMTHDYKMVTKPELLLLQKTLLLVEGVGVILDPELNMWELARPWVADWAKKNIGFDAKIRDGMVELFGVLKKIVRSF